MSELVRDWGFVIVAIELLGIGIAIHALMNVRSDRGTIAWCVALVSMPFVAIPLYALFGRARFLSTKRFAAFRRSISTNGRFI